MYFNDFKLGMGLQIPPAVIEKQKMLDFARTYDNIPLHTDEAYAKASPFGALMDLFGEELLAGKSTHIEWHKPVYADDVLYGKAEITNLVQRNPRNGIVEITIEVYNQNGVHVLSDVTEAIVKCRESEA